LAQHRATACEFDIAVVTNITHEHLNYHGDWEAYFSAKARLFEGLSTATRKLGVPKLAVLNIDDVSYDRLLEIITEPVLSYGLAEAANVTARDIVQAPDATRFILQASLPFEREAPSVQSVQSSSISIPVTSPLIGAFNIKNILAAATVTLGLGVTPQAIQEGVATLQSIPGRMERVSDEKYPFLAVVDFAHTPNALRNALETARSLTGKEGRVIAVWGSAGQRDQEKRYLMGTISAQLADITVITAEDPRSESLEAIMAQSAAACQEAGQQEGVGFWRVPDRGQAMRFAIEMAQAGDVIIACGKGHEQSMCFGTTEYAWDDREALRLALRGKTLNTLPTAKINA
jgi:UDP-N-acetylmuramoyl-L-alanyl-D-glutamate--2,6-diaminopimelate ligase